MTTPGDLNTTLGFLEEAWKLKDQQRAGWNLRGVPEPESVADHSWGTAFLVSLFSDDEGVEGRRALEMALIHDLAEALTGDTPTRVHAKDREVTAEDKRKREYQAMNQLLPPAGPAFRDRVMALFVDYEERRTPEARFVADMNLIDMVLQALIYQRSGRYDRATDDLDPSEGHYPGLSEFFATAEPRLTTVVGRRLFDAIRATYEEQCS